ncbi:MAG: hypothetical protein AAGA20_16970 [Planctomycetota bacterium]
MTLIRAESRPTPLQHPLRLACVAFLTTSPALSDVFVDLGALGFSEAMVFSPGGQTMTDIGTSLGEPLLVGIDLTLTAVPAGPSQGVGPFLTGLMSPGERYRLGRASLTFEFSAPVPIRFRGGGSLLPGEFNSFGPPDAGSLISPHVDLVVTDDSLENLTNGTVVDPCGRDCVVWESLSSGTTWHHTVTGGNQGGKLWIRLGTSLCDPGEPNSTNQPGLICPIGSVALVDSDFSLRAFELPPNTFGFFLTSRFSGSSEPPGSVGVLCLSGSIGRFVGPGQILDSGSTGTFLLPVDLTNLPTPTGPVAAQPGETWYFQTWHRDAVGGSATSNFTNAICVTFL